MHRPFFGCWSALAHGYAAVVDSGSSRNSRGVEHRRALHVSFSEPSSQPVSPLVLYLLHFGRHRDDVRTLGSCRRAVWETTLPSASPRRHATTNVRDRQLTCCQAHTAVTSQPTRPSPTQTRTKQTSPAPTSPSPTNSPHWPSPRRVRARLPAPTPPRAPPSPS